MISSTVFPLEETRVSLRSIFSTLYPTPDTDVNPKHTAHGLVGKTTTINMNSGTLLLGFSKVALKYCGILYKYF